MAACTIVDTVVGMRQVPQAVPADGHPITSDTVAALSPSIMEHIDRCGRTSVEADQPPPPLDESIFSTAWLSGSTREAVAMERPRTSDQGRAAGPIQLPFDGWA